MRDWAAMRPASVVPPVAQSLISSPVSLPAAAIMPPAVIDENVLQRLARENMPLNKDGVLMLHTKLQTALAVVKADEMVLRKLVVKLFVTQPHEGINTVELGSGYILKAQINYNYVLNATNDAIDETLLRITATGNDGLEVAQSLIKWSASLMIGPYNNLMEAAKVFPEARKQLDLINEIIEKRDAAPHIEIKEPKGLK